MDLTGAAGGPITKLQTDIARLRQGRVGAQFWSVWIPVETTGAEAVKATLEQIDIARSFSDRYPDTFALAGSAADIEPVPQGAAHRKPAGDRGWTPDRLQHRGPAAVPRPRRPLHDADPHPQQ